MHIVLLKTNTKKITHSQKDLQWSTITVALFNVAGGGGGGGGGDGCI